MITRSIIIAIIELILSAIFLITVSKWIIKNLVKLTHSADAIARGDYSQRINLGNSKETIELQESFNLMARNIEKNIIDLKHLNKKEKELFEKLKSQVEKNQEQDILLKHQSRMVIIGEMLNNIAHQWRQPLTHLGFINMNLQLAYEDTPINKKYLNEKIEESNSQIDFMSKTIDNFRDFYKQNKQKELFNISDAVKKALDIMEPIFDENKIDFDFMVSKDKQINSYENEYSQVILNILTNAKDALIEKNIENPKIKILIYSRNNISVTSIVDNAKGIDSKYLNMIFEPYFTTKQNGSGIGLYMSKIIIESHFEGKIKVSNIQNGASFSIEV
jgi:nitrogen fixation/metabolism regulation signal transduction histidine kinase